MKKEKQQCEKCGENLAKYKIIQYIDLENNHKDIFVCKECKDGEFSKLNWEFGFSITPYMGDKTKPI